MSTANDRIGHALHDPQRVCPVLASAALIRGGELTVRADGSEHVVKAPPRFLRRLHEWCDGTRTMAQVRKLGRGAALGESFARFLDALYDAGILVDAARCLLDASRVAHYPSWTGLAAAQEVWSQAAKRLVDELPPGAIPLQASSDSALLRLLGQRRSSQAFTDAPVEEDKLSTVLTALYGACGDSRHRSVASAGGFYTLVATLCLLKPVGRWSEGTYRIRFARHSLGLERVASSPAFLARAFVQPRRLQAASFVLVLSCDMRPGSLKYRNRFFQYAFMEAGAAMQNAALACAETGLGMRMLGGFDERMLSGMLALDDSTPLITSVGGSVARADTRSDRPALDMTVGWAQGMSGAPFVAAHATLKDPSGAGGKPCWGRDPDPRLALDKAVAEAIERSAYRRRGPCIEAPASQLDRPWLHPDTLVRYSAAQYRSAGFPFVRFDEHEPRLWTEVRRFGSDEPVLILADFVYHRTSFDAGYAQRLVTHTSSSGCASHRSHAEALSAAVCELVERDAFSRHWLAQRPGTAVALPSLPEALAAQAMDLMRQGIEVQVQVLDASLMPVWFVWLQSVQAGFTCVAAAAGFDAQAALRSALAEAHTGALVRMSGSPKPRIGPRQVLTPRDHADLFATQRHFRRADALRCAAPAVSYASATAQWPGSFEALAAGMRAAGRDIFHIDLTMPDAPTSWDGGSIATVRALVPGLIPLAFGFGRMPLGMVTATTPGGRFPHPFP